VWSDSPFALPGQANSYFYGYTRLLSLREAVLGEFVPSQTQVGVFTSQAQVSPGMASDYTLHYKDYGCRMEDLHQAMSEIRSIRIQVARGSEFRGYGPASIALSGVLALLVAAGQSRWMAGHSKHGIVSYVAVWVSTAAVALALTGIETFARSRRVHSGFASEMMRSATEQFLPALVVGCLLTALLLRVAIQDCWMLPGLWELIFSLGVFASCRFLPRQMFAVGVWYLAAGLYCLAAGSADRALSPWAMGVPFGIGQILVAAVLRFGFQESLE
jgi:hypothetical protein